MSLLRILCLALAIPSTVLSDEQNDSVNGAELQSIINHLRDVRYELLDADGGLRQRLEVEIQALRIQSTGTVLGVPVLLLACMQIDNSIQSVGGPLTLMGLVALTGGVFGGVLSAELWWPWILGYRKASYDSESFSQLRRIHSNGREIALRITKILTDLDLGSMERRSAILKEIENIHRLATEVKDLSALINSEYGPEISKSSTQNRQLDYLRSRMPTKLLYDFQKALGALQSSYDSPALASSERQSCLKTLKFLSRSKLAQVRLRYLRF